MITILNSGFEVPCFRRGAAWPRFMAAQTQWRQTYDLCPMGVLFGFFGHGVGTD